MDRQPTEEALNTETNAQVSTIMLVEDESVTAMDIKSSLVQLGYEVIAVVASGEDAIRRAVELHPDLILMDITLAGDMNGIQAAEEIRKSLAIPIVFLTAHADAETLGQAKKAEPFGYLPKPSTIDTLMSTIEVALHKSRADKRLRETEERYHTVADFTYDWEYWITEQNRIIYMSSSCKRITGYSSSEFIADPDLLSRIVFPDDTASYEEHRNHRTALQEYQGPEELEFRIIDRNGDIRWIHHVCQPIHGADGVFRGIRASNRDITTRKITEANLVRVANEQRIILDNLGVGVLFLKNRKIIWTNKSLADMFGFTIDEAVGNDTEIFYPDKKSYIETGEKGYAALSRGEVFTGEVQMSKKDGSLVWCNLVGQAVNPANLEDGAIWLLEDITERKNMETEIIKVRNLESLGNLAGGIAHDFNNLLQGLLGNIDMAKIYTPATSKAFPFLKNAELAYHAAINLTNQLIGFSGGVTAVRQTIRPRELIRDTVDYIMSGSDIKTVFDLPTDLLPIYVDASQLRQVIGNISLNAKDAMPSGGVLLVSASNETVKPQEISGLAPGSHIKISIRDQGCGIAPELLPKIFDPYFSTKERGAQKGMGLGLTVSDAIIRKHSGVIRVDSEIGKGSVFHIYLPAAVTDAETILMLKDAAKIGPRILIMDDESSVNQITVDYLEFIGYRVKAVINGDEAINAYAAAGKAGDPYAAIILDLSIPGGMGGQEAFVQIRDLDPKVKAIVSSGYANDPVMGEYALYGYSGALVKPYRLEALKEMLEKILG
ncbi:MAG: response regulator [Nitrospirae bacterium]|nr:response regulator [Nitrospirota bacterium]